jgi:DNA (cytosine-5)-methyltransferase 1
MKALNLYAGVGGNRKYWEGCQVTAVEADQRIAAVYQRQNPDDVMVIGDAHEYLREHYAEFDFIWSSPPCQSHSRMNKATRHKSRGFPDMTLYEEILFLRHFFEGRWVVENVVSYYEPLIPASNTIGRHMFWANFEFEAEDVPRPKGFINMSNLAGKKALQDWLGIHYEENIYYAGNHCPAQVLRNCVHPDLGLQIFTAARDAV